MNANTFNSLTRFCSPGLSSAPPNPLPSTAFIEEEGDLEEWKFNSREVVKVGRKKKAFQPREEGRQDLISFF